MKTHRWIARGARFFILLSSLFFTGRIAAASTNPASPQPLRVITSFYPLHIAALNVMGTVPGLALRTLTPPQAGCLHDYQMTPGDLAALSQADLFIINGGGMESFLAQALRKLPDLKIIDTGKNLAVVPPSPAAGNPHYWVSPTLYIQQVTRIAEGLAAADPAHAADFQRNASNYIDRITELRNEMRIALSSLRYRNIITFHEAFAHFALEFGLNLVAVIEPEQGTQPGARELARTIDLARTHQVRALFVEPQFPTQAAQTIARETGLPVFTLDSGATGPVHPDAYLHAMRANLKTLTEALR